MRRLLVLAVIVGASFVWAGSALADATVGQTFSPTTLFSGGYVVVQTAVASGQSFTVPSSGTLTSWSVQSGASVSPMALVVVAPTGVDQYEIVGESATETPTPNTLNTFSTSIAAEAGDLIGFWYSSSFLAVNHSGDPSDNVDYVSVGSEPGVGNTSAYTEYPGYVLDISATLSSDSGSAVRPPNHLFVCYSKYEQDGGQVETYSEGETLMEAGGWAPVAMVGNVTGGDNIGTYHLECNPPSGSTPSGSYLTDGGAVTDQDVSGSYAIET